MRILTFFLCLAAVLGSAAVEAHTVSKFVEATVELPSAGAVGKVDAKVVVRSVWREPVRVEVSGAPRRARGALLQPGQWVEVLVKVPIGSGPKERVSVTIDIGSARGAPLGRMTAHGYARVDGETWTRSTYDALYASKLLAVSGQSFRQVPGWLASNAPVGGTEGEAPTSSVSGELALRDADGDETPGDGFTIEVRNLTTDVVSEPVPADSKGAWTASIPVAAGDVLQFFYRPDNRYLRIRSRSEDVYVFSTGRTFRGGGTSPRETLDFSVRTGVLPGLVDLMATALAFRSALLAIDLPPEREAPLRVHFPNDWFDCGGKSAWSCGDVSGALWLSTAHSLERGPLWHELAHQLDYKHHGATRPDGVGESHMIDTCHSPGLALEEGFASALVEFLRSGASGGSEAIENPDKARICNGDSNEVWVAATFWDLLDTDDDGLDRFQASDPSEVFRAYLNAPMRSSLLDYLPEFRAMAAEPARVDDIFHHNTIRIDFPLLAAGGSAGTPYRVACGTGSYLVGVRGRAGGLLDTIEGLCLDIQGKESTTAVAGGEGGTPFVRRCPEGMLVSGFGGRAGRLFHQLVLECRPTSETELSGAPEKIDWIGGDGGREFSVRRCPKGLAGVGFEGHADRFVNQLALVCKELRWVSAVADASADAMPPPAPETPVPATPSAPSLRSGDADLAMVGGSGGAPFAFECVAGEAVVGIELRAGRLVDAIRPLCALVVGDRTGKARALGDFAGGEAGTLDRRVCPTGSVVSGVGGRAGKFFNALQLRCRPLAGGEATSLPHSGGGGGAPFDPLVCPESLYAKGFRGRSGALLDALSLTCGELGSGPVRTP